MENSDYSKAGDLLGRMMDLMGASGGSEIARLFSAWQGIVGNDIASHSGVEDIRNGTVIILVDHPAWLQQIQFRQKKFLRDLQKTFPTLEIQRMVCKIGNPTIRTRREPDSHDPDTRKPAGENPSAAGSSTRPDSNTWPEAEKPSSKLDDPPSETDQPDKTDFLATMERLKRTLKDT